MIKDLRGSVIDAGLAMMEKGLSIGTGGNVRRKAARNECDADYAKRHPLL